MAGVTTFTNQHATAANAALVQEIYSEFSSSMSAGSPDRFDAMGSATTLFPLHGTWSVVSPFLSARVATASGVHAGGGVQLASPWIPRFPGSYGALRFELRSREGAPPFWVATASGESRHADLLRFNGDGDIEKDMSSVQLRGAIDAFQRAGIVIGAGIGGRQYVDPWQRHQSYFAFSEARWNPAPSLRIGMLLKIPADVQGPALTVSFGGNL